MILNIFKLEAPRVKRKSGSKMAGKKHFFDFVCLSGRKMVVVPPHSIKTLLLLFVSGWMLFGSSRYYADSRKQKKQIKVFFNHQQTYTHIYILLFPFSLHFCIKEGGE